MSGADQELQWESDSDCSSSPQRDVLYDRTEQQTEAWEEEVEDEAEGDDYQDMDMLRYLNLMFLLAGYCCQMM